MDLTPWINGLYGIPVVGLVFQLAGYLVAAVPQNGPNIMLQATPLALGALCGVLTDPSTLEDKDLRTKMPASSPATGRRT